MKKHYAGTAGKSRAASGQKPRAPLSIGSFALIGVFALFSAALFGACRGAEATDGAVVLAVSILDENGSPCDELSGSIGGAVQFKVKVQVKNGASDAVVWRVSGGNNKSAIQQSGRLSIAADETVGTVLIVTATSAGDKSMSASVRVMLAPANTRLYAITVNASQNGTVTPNRSSAAQGDTISLTALPAPNYALNTISVTRVGGSVTVNGSGNNRTFSMPAADVTVSATFINTNPDIPNIGQVVPGKGTLVWQDEFNGSSLDTSKWNYDYGAGGQYNSNLWGWGNNERQWYGTDSVRVQDGKLVIEAGRSGRSDYYVYKSGKITTKGTRAAVGNTTYPPKQFLGVTTGYVEARIKTPKGAGYWPAFWMLSADTDGLSGFPSLGWPQSGEIDILETIGGQENRILQTIHYGQNPYNNTQKWSKGSSYTVNPSAGDQYYVYAVKWSGSGTSGNLKFYCDGAEKMNQNFPLPEGERAHSESFFNDRPWVIILNLAVGGDLGGGLPSDASVDGPNWEARSLMVDWVRVYQ